MLKQNSLYEVSIGEGRIKYYINGIMISIWVPCTDPFIMVGNSIYHVWVPKVNLFKHGTKVYDY